ncbi:MAG: ferritin [Alistipes sp.]|jgi:ferritin|nr:ferritin [Alistipes sp.]
MKLSQKMHEAMNAQVNAEFWSAYLYLSMSADAEAKGYKGVANWFYVQFQEEQAHARILMNHMLSRGARVNLLPIAEVKSEWSSILNMYEETLEHEKKVTSLIHNLYALATDQRDFASLSMLNWFIDEQIEEEESAQGLIDQLEAVDCNKMGLFLIDKDLATRVFNTPAPLAGKE